MRFIGLAVLSLFLVASSFSQAPNTLSGAGSYAGVRIGTAVDSFYLTDPTYSAVLSANYTQVQAENEMKFDATEPMQNTFNYAGGDAIGVYASQHNMAFRGHNLVWYNQVSPWVTSGNFTPAQLYSILQNHIANVAGHYAGKVYAWDVVNEAFDDNGDGGLRNSVWYNQPGIGLSGTGYIEQAFDWARMADPNALLFYNDYSIEDLGSKSDAVYAMVKDFRSRGVPIDGVGFQMHITLGGYPTISGFAANLQRFTDLGVQVQITEMDVRLQLDANGNPSASDLQSQATTYSQILAVCLANPMCTAFQTWGFTDLHSWIPSTYPGYGAALPFDMGYNPKPAFNSILAELNAAPPRYTAGVVLNAASYQGTSVAPGELITVFGGALGPIVLSGLQLDTTGAVSTSNAGLSVRFDGVAAPIVFALDTQIAVIVPFEVSGKRTTIMTVTYNGGSSSATLSVAAKQPGLFTADASGTGSCACYNVTSGAGNSTANPAAAGDYIAVFGTGDGVETGGYLDGQLVTASNLPMLQGNVTATIGTVPAPVGFLGGSPGLVAGVFQANVQIPNGLSTGTYPLTLTVGGVSTQSGVTVAVK